jgi:hypothetical protein
MGIGRREFIAEFGAAMAVLASAQRVAGVLEDLYVSRQHGIAFRKPAGWVFENVQAANANVEGILLDLPGFDSDTWASHFRAETSHHALVVVADHPRARPIRGWKGPKPETFCPIFTLAYEGVLEDNADEHEIPATLMQYVNVDLPLTSRFYKRFRVLKDPVPRTISGCDAVEYTSEHLFDHVHLPEPVMARERALYIHQGPAIYSIRMADYPSFSPPLVHDFDEFIETVRVL